VSRVVALLFCVILQVKVKVVDMPAEIQGEEWSKTEGD
jgi:hypothetical protein